MQGQNEVEPKVQIPEGELIGDLIEEPNYFALEYNRQRQDAEAREEKPLERDGASSQTLPHPSLKAQGIVGNGSARHEQNQQVKVVRATPVSRAGGVYVPPHKLRQLQEQMIKEASQSGEQKQRVQWEMLRKSINEIINKVASA